MNRAIFLGAMLLAVQASAEDKPRHAGYDVLGNLVGIWTIAGKEQSYRETCAWYPGERHILCNTESRKDDGSIAHSMSILGFVPGEGYVYTGIGGAGRYETHAKGSFNGGLLQYTDEAGGEWTRISVGPFSDRQIVPFQVHVSKNGTDWELVDSFDYVRLE